MATLANSTPASTSDGFRRTLLKMRRRALEDAIETGIALLDSMDPDPEAEPDACFELSAQAPIRGGSDVRAA